VIWRHAWDRGEKLVGINEKQTTQTKLDCCVIFTCWAMQPGCTCKIIVRCVGLFASAGIGCLRQAHLRAPTSWTISRKFGGDAFLLQKFRAVEMVTSRSGCSFSGTCNTSTGIAICSNFSTALALQCGKLSQSWPPARVRAFWRKRWAALPEWWPPATASRTFIRKRRTCASKRRERNFVRLGFPSSSGGWRALIRNQQWISPVWRSLAWYN